MILWKQWFSGLAEFESVIKISVAQFFRALFPIFARIFYITGVRWIVRSRGRRHRVSRRILHMDAALLQNFVNVKLLSNALTIVRAFLFVDLSNLLDFIESAVIVDLGLAEFESDIKIRVEPFLDGLGQIFARNFYIARKRMVRRAPGRLHRVSRRILHIYAALLQKFSKCPNPRNALTNCIFCGRFIEFGGFCGNRCYWGFGLSRIQIRLRNMGCTIFMCPFPNFSMKFLHSSSSVDRTGSGRRHHVSRRTLHMDAELLQKFCKCPTPPKCPHSEGIFFVRFIEFV